MFEVMTCFHYFSPVTSFLTFVEMNLLEFAGESLWKKHVCLMLIVCLLIVECVFANC